MSTKKRFKKGKFYLVHWENPINPLTGYAKGNILARKRTATSDHFTEPVYIQPGTRVLFVKRGKHGMCQVLYEQTLVQLYYKALHPE